MQSNVVPGRRRPQLLPEILIECWLGHGTNAMGREKGRRQQEGLHHDRGLPRTRPAFAAVLVLIYVLVVGWFQSFKTPLLIMAAIPFSLVGVLPARRDGRVLHGDVDDRLHRRCGHRGAQFVSPGGLHRTAAERGASPPAPGCFCSMALTAAAMIVGAAVILFDPIFQGLAISLMAGEVASLGLAHGRARPLLHGEAPRAPRTATHEEMPAAA